MKSINKIFIGKLFVMFLYFSFGQSYAQVDSSFSASITQDFVSNISGGIKKGQAYLGLIDLQFELNSNNVKALEHSYFRIQIQNTYGQIPTQDLVGDAQVFSNIENGNCTYLHQLWYQYQNKGFSFLIGKHDLNEQFFTSEYGASYVNSSLGIMPVVSLNVPVSIFPATTLGLSGSYQVTDQLKFQAATYNGYPCDPKDVTFGIDLNMRWDQGLFYLGEVHLTDLFNNAPGTYKFGSFYHGGEMEVLGTIDETQKGVSGYYLIADQKLLSGKIRESSSLGMLFQLGYAPDKTALNDFYMAYGLNYSGLFGLSNDELALAVAHASTNDMLVNDQSSYAAYETVFELTYSFSIILNLVIKPDFQYIIHPGMQATNDDSFVGLMRVSYTY